MQTIKVSNSLTLQLLQLQNTDSLHKLIHKNYQWLYNYVDWIRFEDAKSTTCTYNFIKHYINEYLNNKQAIYTIKLQDIIIGLISLTQINIRNQSAEIGYWLDKDHTGQKIMQNCVKSMVYAWYNNYNIKRFVLKASTHNIASNKIATNLNFNLEGCLIKAERIGDTWYNQNLYALVL